jgi:prepilin-type N-terminal cleavage/methylation domain-containing protein
MRTMFKFMYGLQRGFTLAEVILTVAVLAVLTTLTTPALVHFLRQRDVREEISMQLQVRDAMVAMLTATSDLPDDTATGTNAWYNKLAAYTNLSPNQLQFDQWNQARSYIMLRNNQTMLGSPVTIFYITIHSKGPDLKATQLTDSGGTVVAPVSGNDFAASSNTSWWKFNANPTTAFGAVGVPASSDDLMLRYTDYPDKIAAYNATLDRLNKLTDALEAYNRSAYANRVVACNGSSPPADCSTSPPEKQIHYPMGYGMLVGDGSGLYNATVLADTTTITGGTSYFYDGADNNARRTAMIQLMRLLGMPDSYCCSAIDHFTDSGGAIQQTPFYYVSNPRARASASTCGSRFNGSNTALPARLSNTYTADGTTGASCF